MNRVRPLASAARHVLLAGNHTCGNRGDGAILRGLIDCLEASAPQLRLTVTSRYPTSSAYLLGREVVPDLTHDWPERSTLRPYRLKQRVVRHVPALLAAAVEGKRALLKACPRPVLDAVGQIASYDAVIQVGGSFFVDLYGGRQYETAFAALLAGRPLFLAGHSLGPFSTSASRSLARTLLSRSSVVLREAVSLELLRDAGLPLENVSVAADTAWLVSRGQDKRGVREELRSRTGDRPAIAITLRDLAPFDKRLGISQQVYEQAFADLCTALIGQGYDIVAAAMCTGLEGYRDDRIPALRVAQIVNRPGRFHVIMDELNDLDIGHLLSSCSLLIGTRLHSAIIAMNFGTPAIALNYEHKSRGIMHGLGLPEACADLAALLDGSLLSRAIRMAGDRSNRMRMLPLVENERNKAREGVRGILQQLGLEENRVVRLPIAEPRQFAGGAAL